MSLAIHPSFEPESCTWSYLLADTATGEAAIIDPVWVYDAVSGQVDRSFTDQQLAMLRENGWTLRWILETHAHADHLSAGDLLRQETGATLAIGRGIRDVQANFARVYHTPDVAVDGRQFDRLLEDGDELPLGERTIHVLETPGHTSDSVTYRIDDALFIGDTLFEPGFGSARCDFPGGDATQLYASIQRLHAFPPDTRLFLCHDYPAAGDAPTAMVTVADSLANNIHAPAGTTEADYVALREARDAQLGLPKLILPAIQVNVLGGAPPDPEANGVSYLKIPFNRTIPSLLSQNDD